MNIGYLVWGANDIIIEGERLRLPQWLMKPLNLDSRFLIGL